MSPRIDVAPRVHHGLYRNGLVEFPIDKLEELQRKLSALTNWVGHVSRQALISPNFSPEQSPLLKYDFFVTQLLQPETTANLLRPEPQTPAGTRAAEL